MKGNLSTHLLILVALFALTRAWPISCAEPWNDWQVFEARKLNEYGWLARRGALLDVHYLTGVVAHPERFNYVNHPAPIHWGNMLVQRFFGDWGVVFAATLVGLAACVLALLALRQLYSPGIALVGAILFAIAPSSIIYDVDANHGALAAVLWPVATLALAPSLAIGPRAWLLGIACLLAGQASWMVWPVFGALFLGVFGIAWDQRFRATPSKPLIAALLIGGGLTVLFFVLQVAVYTPDWDNLFRYLGKQSTERIGVVQWAVRSVTRSGMSLGPALVLGALGGFLAIVKTRTARPTELVALAYLPLFVAASFILRGFFYNENWPYEYLVFPAAILTCAFLAALPVGRLRFISSAGLLGLAVVGLFYVFLRFSNPSLSAETRFIANLIAREAKPREVVATNMVEQMPPLQTWNVSGLYVARQKADRLLRTEISSLDKLGTLLDRFHADTLDIVFLRTPLQPVDTQLAQVLSRAPAQIHTLPAHDGALPFSLRLRDYYWKLTGRHQPAGKAGNSLKNATLELSRLRVTRSGDGGVQVEPLPPTDVSPDVPPNPTRTNP